MDVEGQGNGPGALALPKPFCGLLGLTLVELWLAAKLGAIPVQDVAEGRHRDDALRVDL
jgi:hypothetical protein